METDEICALVRNSQDEILQLWEERTRQEPWMRLPEGARIDHLPELLGALADSVLCIPDEESSRRRVIEMAVRHGAHRARDGFDDPLLYKEYHLLRECIWEVVERQHPRSQRAVEVISRIDMAITNSTTGSLHGYHHAGDDDGEMRAIVDRLVEQSTWPPPLETG